MTGDSRGVCFGEVTNILDRCGEGPTDLNSLAGTLEAYAVGFMRTQLLSRLAFRCDAVARGCSGGSSGGGLAHIVKERLPSLCGSCGVVWLEVTPHFGNNRG